MANIDNMNNRQALYWTELDWKDIKQSLVKYFMADDELSAVFSPETVLNGIKQYIYNGLLKKADWKKNIELKDWNPENPAIKDTYITTDYQWVYSIKVPNVNGLETGFSSPENKKKFKMDLVQTLYNSAKKDIFYIRMKTILTGKVKNASGNLTDYGLDFDETVKWNTVAEITDGLVEMDEKLGSFGTLSKQHTKFGRDNSAEDWHTSYSPKDMIIVWNNKYKSLLKKVPATLYKGGELLFDNAKNIRYDFSLIEGLNNAEKATASKTVCYFIHKDALKEILPADYAKLDHETNNFETLAKALFMFGLGRIKLYPIGRFRLA